MNVLRLVAAAFVIVTAGCVSSSSVESRLPTDSGPTDLRRRAETHTSLAGEYYSRGNYAVALQETRLATTYVDSYVPAWNMQGLILMELREDVLAREAFDRAIRLEPNNAEVLNNFGWFLCLRGDYPRGLELLGRAAADPLYPTPEKSFLSSGLCHRRAGRLAEAELLLRRAVTLRPDLIGALYNLAQITFERGASADAEGFITRYMRIANPSVEALDLGVQIALATGNRGAEESYVQQMRRRYPDSPLTKKAAEGRRP